ncbi:MAG: DEAD/DEAH box helicase, partial [Chloroflexi bacterium]
MARRRASPGRQVSQSPALKFEQRLVLHQWMLDLFGVSSFERLAANLKAPELEGFDENNVTRFHHVLRLGDMETRGQGDRSPSPRRQVSPSELLAYDQNIVRHWRRITERRNHAGPFLYPKYFQYLALLFTEIYLDRYFRDPERLLTELNAHVGAFNARLGDMETRG